MTKPFTRIKKENQEESTVSSAVRVVRQGASQPIKNTGMDISFTKSWNGRKYDCQNCDNNGLETHFKFCPMCGLNLNWIA